MSKEISSQVYSFILSWNLRNLVDTCLIMNPEAINIIGMIPGEFPVDAWKSYFLEIPKGGSKKDIVGRSLRAFGISMRGIKWISKRIIPFPIYTCSPYSAIENLKLIIKHWNDAFISDDMPCLALAVKTSGYYCEDREVQSVAILPIWNDEFGRIISLDWIEGPLEDCITPEWYIETTQWLNLENALKKMQKLHENPPSWENTSFSIYVVPSCLGYKLHGKKSNTSYELWEVEWKYDEHAALKEDLISILSEIRNTFFEITVGGINER